jgi:hypothetical protein
MKYTVVWTLAALDELSVMWTLAADRAAVAAASNDVDRLLGHSPEVQGESRGENVRVMFVRPICVDFEVLEQDRTVRVLTVWRVKPA